MRKRISALEKHIFLEKCAKSLENDSLLDLTKIGYKSKLEEGVGTLPTMKATLTQQRSNSPSTAKVGRALKTSTKSYHFNKKENSYFDSKFETGQTAGRKLNGELVAKK